MTGSLRAAIAMAALSLAAVVGCAHQQKVTGLDTRLQAISGGYITGEISGLERTALLDNKEFVYAVALSDDASLAAYTHLFGKKFGLGLWSLQGAPAKRFDIETNDYWFDVEGLDFSPDGKVVATAGRDGVVRFWSTADGKPEGAFFTEEPLVSVAFSPRGDFLVAGSARGLLTLIRWPDLAYISETRGHSDEVRAIAIAPDGRVVSGSWDKSIAVFAVEDAPLNLDEVHLSVGQTQARVQVVRVGVDGKMGLFAYDASLPHVVVNTELARAAGIDPNLLQETEVVMNHPARIARGKTVQLKQLEIAGVDIAVCDACVPKEAHGVLGAPVLSRFQISANPVTGELVLVAKEKRDPTTLPRVPTLKEKQRHTFPAFVNDLSLDRAGARLGVAFSHERAERNYDVYARERAGKLPPVHEEDVGAIVDLATGKMLKRWRHHVGVVSTAAISPDGRSLVTGGWDNRLFVWDEDKSRFVAEEKFGWNVRRARFSRDGRFLVVGAWTPPNAVGDQESDPSAVVYEVAYSQAEVVAP